LLVRIFPENLAGANRQKWIGLGRSGTPKGLFIGASTTSTSRLALCKYDGTTSTELAAETGNSLVGGAISRFDVQLVNYGASATVNVYINGVNVITFIGDVTVSGVTDVDSVYLGPDPNLSGTQFVDYSEIIVADEDLRAWPGILTMALTGAGTTNQWTANTFSNINGTTISDASPTSDNTNGQVQEYNITDLPTGNFTIKAVKIAARSAKSASPAVTQVQLGYNSGGSVAYGSGATKAVTTAYATYEQYDATNPITSAAWASSDINGLQLDIKAVT
jgi:hypothetical protein